MHAIRRIAVFLFVSLATITCVQTASAQPDWSNTPDRVWLGADFWANPMEDWRVVDGEAECVFGGGGRNVHLLTHQLTDPSRPMELSVRVRRVEPGPNGGGAGFRIGNRFARDDLLDEVHRPLRRGDRRRRDVAGKAGLVVVEEAAVLDDALLDLIEAPGEFAVECDIVEMV
jgi:hypothetical protein